MKAPHDHALPDKECHAAWGGEERQSSDLENLNTTGRHPERAIAAMRAAFDLIGQPNLADELGTIFRARLGRLERLLIAGAALISLAPADRETMADAAQSGRDLGEMIEARRQRLLGQWKTEREGCK